MNRRIEPKLSALWALAKGLVFAGWFFAAVALDLSARLAGRLADRLRRRASP